MNRVTKFILSLVAILIVGTPGVRAQGGLSLGAKVGTLGPGLEFTGYLNDNLNIRAGGHYLKFTFDGDVDDVDYEYDQRFAMASALLDVHPFDNNFRITAGAMFNNNKVNIKGTSDEPVEINDTDYSTAQFGTLKGKAEFNDVAPYFGFGFGNPVTDDTTWSFSFDIGVVFQGDPEVTLSATGPINSSPQFQSDLKDEEEEVEDDLEVLSYYPLIEFGVAYYFW